VRVRMAHAIGCEGMLRWRSAEVAQALAGHVLPDGFYDRVLDPGWSGYPLRERLAIAFAERLALDPKRLDRDEALWRGLRAQFDEGELADLALIAGAWLGLGRALQALDVAGA
jgi:alkylhydroperoxidase family enzyme